MAETNEDMLNPHEEQTNYEENALENQMTNDDLPPDLQREDQLEPVHDAKRSRLEEPENRENELQYTQNDPEQNEDIDEKPLAERVKKDKGGVVKEDPDGPPEPEVGVRRSARIGRRGRKSYAALERDLDAEFENSPASARAPLFAPGAWRYQSGRGGRARKMARYSLHRAGDRTEFEERAKVQLLEEAPPAALHSMLRLIGASEDCTEIACDRVRYEHNLLVTYHSYVARENVLCHKLISGLRRALLQAAFVQSAPDKQRVVDSVVNALEHVQSLGTVRSAADARRQKAILSTYEDTLVALAEIMPMNTYASATPRTKHPTGSVPDVCEGTSASTGEANVNTYVNVHEEGQMDEMGGDIINPVDVDIPGNQYTTGENTTVTVIEDPEQQRNGGVAQTVIVEDQGDGGSGSVQTSTFQSGGVDWEPYPSYLRVVRNLAARRKDTMVRPKTKNGQIHIVEAPPKLAVEVPNRPGFFQLCDPVHHEKKGRMQRYVCHGCKGHPVAVRLADGAIFYDANFPAPHGHYDHKKQLAIPCKFFTLEEIAAREVFLILRRAVHDVDAGESLADSKAQFERIQQMCVRSLIPSTAAQFGVRVEGLARALGPVPSVHTMRKWHKLKQKAMRLREKRAVEGELGPAGEESDPEGSDSINVEATKVRYTEPGRFIKKTWATRMNANVLSRTLMSSVRYDGAQPAE